MVFGADYLVFVRTLAPDSRLRFAPTPSGFLHPGNALNFTLIWLAARFRPPVRILLRIDDLDAERKRPDYVADIFESLHALDLDWDEGPQSPADLEANWSQKLRISLYNKALDQLRETGLLYACTKSRRDLAPFGGHYPLEFREQKLDLDTPNVAWRIATPPDFPLPDFVVRRRDGVPAYQVASVVDDLHFGVSHVIRGVDLEASTGAQRWLAEQLGWPDFQRIRFLHHPLLMDEFGNKLSKSAGANSWHALHETGEDTLVFQQVAALLDLPTESMYNTTTLLTALQSALTDK